ncbi:MAG: hypothetical protein R6X02_20645 [Enhygromyxa sp.]
MSSHAQIQQLVASSWQQVSRVLLHQTRKRRLRLIALLELPFFVIYWIFAAIATLIINLLASSADDMADLSLPAPRFWTYWQEIEVVLVAPDGNVVARAQARPRTTAEAFAVIATLLDAAHRQGVMVIQTVEGQVIERWYGGQPLLAAPAALDRAVAEATVRSAHLLPTSTATNYAICRQSEPISKASNLLFLGLYLLFWPCLIFMADMRRSFRRTLVEFQTGCTEGTVLEITRDGMLHCRSEQGPRKTPHFSIAAPQLLAISFAPALLADRDVTRTAPRLRFVTTGETFEFPLHLDGTQGAALRDLLVAAALYYWHDVVTIAQRASHCPYCGSTYVFTIGQPCPSCGGWPTQAAR